MITDVGEGTVRVLLAANCPVIEDGSKVVIEEVYNFPATDSQFVTIRAWDKFNTNQHGKPEPIISTVRLYERTFQEEWIPIG